MKPLCLIPARGGSKGVPNKNIRKLNNKPLIAHTITSCLKSNLFSDVIVSTENQKIAKIASKYGATIPFLRPKKLATDNASMNDVLLHAINQLYKLDYDFDIIVLRDCTVPFINKKDVEKAIKTLEKTGCDLVCGVYKQHHNPYFNMMEISKNGFLKFSKKTTVTTRQKAPIVLQLNGLFVINIKRFLKFKKIYMPKILPVIITPESGFMIDTEFEFQIANLIAQKKIYV